jgi:hypothetical protein
MVETKGIEPSTFALRTLARSPNGAILRTKTQNALHRQQIDAQTAIGIDVGACRPRSARPGTR